MGRYEFDDKGSMVEVDRPKKRSKRCPFCAEIIQLQAIKCRFCGEFLHGDRHHSEPPVLVDDELEQDEYESPEESGEEYEDDQWEEEESVLGDEAEEAEDEEDEDSHILFAGRPSVFALVGLLINTGLLLGLCVLVWAVPLVHYLNAIPQVQLPADQLEVIQYYATRSALGIAVLALVVLVYRIAALKSTYYEVSADRIEWSRGIFNREIDNIDMFRVVDLSLRRSILDCMVGIGSVIIVTSDKSEPVFMFEKVHHSRTLYNVIKKASLQADKDVGVYHME